MSLHSSLRRAGASFGSLRNVLKRYERVRFMMTQGTWTEGQSVLGLPKIKQLKMKARKAAAKEKEEATAEKPAASTGTPA